MGQHKIEVANTGVKWLTIAAHWVNFTSATRCDKLQVKLDGHGEYDGMIKFQPTIVPRGDGKVDSRDLVVPFRKEGVALMHATSDGYRTYYYGGAVPDFPPGRAGEGQDVGVGAPPRSATGA